MDDLVSEFITETSESLAVLDSQLITLEQDPGNEEILGNIFRLVHTIKGTCGFLGLPKLESVAHAGENVLGKIRDKEIDVTPKAISHVLSALDRVREITEYLQDNGTEPDSDDSALIARLNAFADSNGGESAPDAEAVKDENAEENDALSVDNVANNEEGNEAEQENLDDEADVNSESLEPDDLSGSAAIAGSAAPIPVAEELSANEPTPSPHAMMSSANSNQTIRVNLHVLETLMQMVGELVLTRNQLLQLTRGTHDESLTSPLQRLSHITSELQDGIMKTRMQPISNAWAKFPRLIRDLAMDLGKEINLEMIGSDTELDRQLLEMIKDPLTHMVRNSCDHGLETPEEREKAGKSRAGQVTLSAYHEGGHIIIEIADNGRGVNVDRVTQKILENELATKEELAAMVDSQIIQYIFKPGFSTAEKVTSISGRGVGMDVVRNNIEKIGGTVELHSVMGKGSTFHIKIPLTLAIVSVLIVEARGQRFALPQINVLELVRTSITSENKIEMINRSPVLRLRGELLPLISLANVLGIDDNKPFKDNDAFITVCKVGGAEFGIIVDAIHDTEEIVVKPVSRCLQHIPLYSGNTVLGDGSVVMILDPGGISKTTQTELEAPASMKALQTEEAAMEHDINFLKFHTDDGVPKAVALELVARLEEIEVSEIEYSSGHPVMQYRGDLMTLTTTPDHEMPKEGLCDVIVFRYDQQSIGLVVKQITDIVPANPDVQLNSQNPLYHGSIVMEGIATDILNVATLLKGVVTSHDSTLDSAPQKAKRRDMNILFVEDSMFFRNMTVPFLAEAGFQVVAAPSGKDALSIIKEKKFDAIVTDIEMPGMNGFELAVALRENPDLEDVPIFAFTSTSNDMLHINVKESGMNGFVLKTERSKLIDLLNEHAQTVVLEEVV